MLKKQIIYYSNIENSRHIVRVVTSLFILSCFIWWAFPIHNGRGCLVCLCLDHLNKYTGVHLDPRYICHVLTKYVFLAFLHNSSMLSMHIVILYDLKILRRGCFKKINPKHIDFESKEMVFAKDVIRFIWVNTMLLLLIIPFATNYPVFIA